MFTDIHESKTYSRFYDIDLPGGQEWEGFFRSLVAVGKIECKRDKLAYKTGNIFIEYECRGELSGISITEADWWVIGIDNENGDIETAVLASVPLLKAKCRSLFKTSRNVLGGDNKVARGILLKMDDFR